MNRYENLRLIQQLDPVTDHCKIYHLMVSYEFFWEINRAFEIALLKTFCVPAISAVLDKTGEFYFQPQKRSDDTSIIIAELARWGYDSDRGQEVIRRMNRMHSRHKIANEDYLYVLSTLIYEPIRWNDRFGWRPMTETEKLAAFYFWKAVGERMFIQNIPDTYEELETFYQQYQERNFRYSNLNDRLSNSIKKLILGWFPIWLRPVIGMSFCALLDDEMATALGLNRPISPVSGLVTSLLKLRSYFVHLLPPRQQDGFLTRSPYRTYPEGYQLTDLGPNHMLKSLNHKPGEHKVSKCPFHALMNRLGA